MRLYFKYFVWNYEQAAEAAQATSQRSQNVDDHDDEMDAMVRRRVRVYGFFMVKTKL